MSDRPVTLQVENLRTHFLTKAGVAKAVDDVSFAVDRGEVLGLVALEGQFPLGWGKRVRGLVKNHYPMGLRKN